MEKGLIKGERMGVGPTDPKDLKPSNKMKQKSTYVSDFSHH